VSAEPQPRPDEPLYLTFKSDLSLALGDESVSRERLPNTLDAAAKGDLKPLPDSDNLDRVPLAASGGRNATAIQFLSSGPSRQARQLRKDATESIGALSGCGR